MTLTDATALVGAVFGVSGFVLAVTTFLRDRPRVVVRLKWDLAVTRGSTYDPSQLWGIVTVANAGRRSIYVSHVALRLPAGGKSTHLVLQEGIAGTKLSEGDAPAIFVVDQTHLTPYATGWKDIVAQVSDVRGNKWCSPRQASAMPPSWARATPTSGA